MANESRTRQGRPPAASQNSAWLGVILVLFAALVAILLFAKGGGNASDDGGDRTAAQAANGSKSSKTTTTSTPPATTPPGNLVVLVGNGSGVSGRAKATMDKLTNLGYTNIKAVDGKDSGTTIVYFAAGFEEDAKALAAQMNLPAERVQALPAETPLKVPVNDAQLVALVGSDFDPATAQFGTTTTAGGSN
jgi:hypothetical protein